eukprot:CAMPEP_0177640456 /NCGR_PEP_ID=MMETSP0447-20121125/6552_1 /TAXON_ID=0 /ORGANISM="Stygamoeba regulata, Strain BSH-02190019" /LENGTH=775 /DNA_ID=CAMNT_0019142527 /DNA_START=47 /DNA_END=2374 /DNA_ORIENTATION=-
MYKAQLDQCREQLASLQSAHDDLCARVNRLQPSSTTVGDGVTAANSVSSALNMNEIESYVQTLLETQRRELEQLMDKRLEEERKQWLKELERERRLWERLNIASSSGGGTHSGKRSLRLRKASDEKSRKHSDEKARKASDDKSRTLTLSDEKARKASDEATRKASSSDSTPREDELHSSSSSERNPSSPTTPHKHRRSESYTQRSLLGSLARREKDKKGVEITRTISRDNLGDRPQLTDLVEQGVLVTESSCDRLRTSTIIACSKEFAVEPGSPEEVLTGLGLSFSSKPLTHASHDYLKFFFHEEHFNYIADDQTLGPIILSVLVEGTSSAPKLAPDDVGALISPRGGASAGEERQWRALIRTKAGTRMIQQPGTISRSKLLAAADLSDSLILHEVRNERRLVHDLLNFEHDDVTASTAIKVGVLYSKVGQTEDEMFSNETGSEDFNEFLSFLGDRVQLKNWRKFRGGLDVKNDTTGTESVYQTHQDYELMFHVSTLLPHSSTDAQQLERKRHIGNDIVLLVFREGEGEPFCPNDLNSQFNYVFLVVTKVHNPKEPSKIFYQVGCALREGVLPIEPFLLSPPIYEANDDFRAILLDKVINGELAAFHAPSFAAKIVRTREAQLLALCEKYEESVLAKPSERSMRMVKRKSLMQGIRQSKFGFRDTEKKPAMEKKPSEKKLNEKKASSSKKQSTEKAEKAEKRQFRRKAKTLTPSRQRRMRPKSMMLSSGTSLIHHESADFALMLSAETLSPPSMPASPKTPKKSPQRKKERKLSQ